MASGVSIMAHSRVLSGAPALAIASVARTMSAPVDGLGIRMASGPTAAAAARSAAPHGVSSPLMRMISSRLP